MGQLDNKAIVVIGGTSGLGLSAARAFVREGSSVVAVGRKENLVAEAAEALGSRARTLAADAAEPQTARHAITLCRDAFGSFDGLYHVAGGSGRELGDGPVDEVTDDAIPATLALNLHSVIYSTRAAIQVLLEMNRTGSILTMSSVLSFFPSQRYFATHIYAAAKAGIVGFSRSVAARYAPSNIRVNVIAPGLVDTPMARRAAANSEILEFIRGKQPLEGGRIGRPDDLDAAAVFFMADGSRFCTGQVLFVDGGWSVSDGGTQ